MAISRHSVSLLRRGVLLAGGAALLALAAVAPARASSPAAWEELRLRAVQTCTAELLSRNVNVLAVVPLDSSGATYTPTEDGMRLRLKVQKPGQNPRSLTCSYRRPLFNPAP
jgi:hypothetical protein